ncbi:prolipoprotein diacylglyceryl transferase [Motiliproteus sp.]|uniref:prolipoprotein diacylglyceryl transferase n=1 Tax=Motiliproteus sp. TaxID=1898955 RepID=UPI003BA8AF98
MLTFPQIDPVALQLGPLKIHWYGLMYLGGFAAAWWLANRRAKRPDSGWTPAQVSDLIFYCALGVVLGGRFGYVLFYNLDRFLAEPLWLFAVWEGGMAFHGGLLGVMAAIWWFGRKYHKGFFQVGDFVAPLVPIGLGLGRLGNFIGGELWGRATDLPWGMVFPRADELARHPSQLYQFALEGVTLFCLLWWFSSRPRPAMAVSGLFLIGYGSFRFLVEFAREPDAHLGFIAFDWLTMGQLLSLPMVLAGVLLMVLAYRTGTASAAR